MHSDLFWIPGTWRGKLAITPRPRGGDWLDDEAAVWKQSGVDAIVSLLEDHEVLQFGLLDEAHAAARHGIDFISFPIPDRSVPDSREAAIEMIGRIATRLDAGQNIALHCRQSVGRSGMIAAGLLIQSGMQAERAIQVVSTARGTSIPETPDQRAWLQQLPAHALAL